MKPLRSIKAVPKNKKPPEPHPEAYRNNQVYRDVILIVAHEIWNRTPQTK